MLATAIGGQAGDYFSTQKALGGRCVEANPLMQNQSVMLGTKVGLSAMAYLVSNACDSHSTRKWWLGIMSVIGWGATIHNATIDCN